MKKLFFYLIAFLIFGAQLSCEQKSIDDSSSPQEQEGFKEEGPSEIDPVVFEIDEKVAEIDRLCQSELNEARSLTWEKSIGDENQVLATTTFLDDKGTIYKVIEKYKEPNKGDQGRVSFYFDENGLFFVFNQFDRWNDSNQVEIYDQKFYLDDKENIIDAVQKKALTIEEIESASWKPIAIDPPSPERAFNIIQEKEPFKTHFLTYIETDESFFLVLGEPKSSEEERYITTVMANPNDPFVQAIRANKDQVKFKEVDIDYFYNEAQNQPRFTILKSAKWVE